MGLKVDNPYSLNPTGDYRSATQYRAESTYVAQ